MYLALAATEMEMQALNKVAGNIECHRLVTGLGLVETVLCLTSWLQDNKEKKENVDGVINFGVAGAYQHNGSGRAAQLLDTCLATHEVLGDLGICLQGKIERLTANNLQVKQSFVLDPTLLSRGSRALEGAGIASRTGRFVTVQCVSGTEQRGNILGVEFQGLCENMEGAGVARVCDQFAVPVLEVRCISNLVEDRNTDNWQLRQACTKAGQAAAVIIKTLAASK